MSRRGVGSVGVVVGLASEARCLSSKSDDAGLLVACAGADPARAAAASRRLIEQGCAALVSFGVAGGLAAGIEPGTVILADAVVSPDGNRLETDQIWRNRLAALLAPVLDVLPGAVAGSGTAITDCDAKTRLQRRSGAVAVDMESHAVAMAATSSGVPFLAIRAIADSAERTLPAWLASTIRPDGSTDMPALMRGLVRQPHDLPVLIRTGMDFRRAIRALSRVVANAGPGFQFLG